MKGGTEDARRAGCSGATGGGVMIFRTDIRDTDDLVKVSYRQCNNGKLVDNHSNYE